MLGSVSACKVRVASAAAAERGAVGAGSCGEHSGQALSNVSPQLPSARRGVEVGVSCLNSGIDL